MLGPFKVFGTKMCWAHSKLLAENCTGPIQCFCGHFWVLCWAHSRLSVANFVSCAGPIQGFWQQTLEACHRPMQDFWKQFWQQKWAHAGSFSVAPYIRKTYILLYCAFSCFFVLLVLFEGKKVTLRKAHVYFSQVILCTFSYFSYFF